MFRVLVLCVAVTLIPVRAQPSFCSEDVHCSEGYYCERENKINECRECLSCEDLMREPPAAYKQCIKSVVDCGDCINNLVVDRRADVNSKCVPPDTSELQSTPSYVWIFIGLGVLLLIAIFVGIIAYLVIFKTPDYDNQSSTVTARITATAPEAPPPYNPLPQSPYHSPVYTDVETTAYNEEEQFIKPKGGLTRPQDARESAGNQAARVYDKPIYERDIPPPSPESPVPEYTEPMTLPDHDEDTMPSPWMPNSTTSNGDVNANVVSESGGGDADSSSTNLPALLAAARDTTLVEHSAAKKRCVRQDSLNNRNRESSSCGDSSQNSFPRSPSPSQGQGGPYSFITQITNVVQINTGK